MPFNGLKPAATEPLHLATADKALQTGNLKPVTNLLSAEMEKEAEKLFKQAMEAKKSKDESVEKGRQWVDAYVKYIVYINGLYKTIQAGPEHGVD